MPPGLPKPTSSAVCLSPPLVTGVDPPLGQAYQDGKFTAKDDSLACHEEVLGPPVESSVGERKRD